MGKQKPQFEPAITGGVVVGHDGTDKSDRAVQWAFEEARLRGCPLHVVRAWTLPTAIRDTGAPFGTVPSLQECEEAVGEHLARTVAALGTERVEVHRHPVHGADAEVLMAAAEQADLLVVGERGGGGFAGLRLGSVAEQLARHAPCTVVIAR